MSTGNIPLSPAIPDQLITSALWNAEFGNLQTLTAPEGIEGYMDTDPESQIQTAPYPGSVLSKSTSLAGDEERLRYQISKIIGKTYWYEAPDSDIKTMFNSLVPIGACIDYPTNTAPNVNFHLADGTAISRAAYPDLFTLIGTTFGVGNGTTTFNLPDYRDRMSIGAGNLYAGAATGGATTHTLTASEIPSTGLTVPITDPGHTHTITDPNHSHGVTDPGHVHGATMADSVASSGKFARSNGTTTGTTNTNSATTGLTVNSGSTGITGANSGTTGITAALAGGGGAAHSILNPYLGMYKLIRVL